MPQPFGRYNLVGHLASGGMADVYRAEISGEAGFSKEVAIKIIRGGFGDRPEFVEMFKQEARLASRLNHAGLVQVFDFGQIDGLYYIAMELVRGRTLGEITARCRSLGRTLDLPRAVHLCSQVANALDYAHRQKENGELLGLVHRDVSPQNVLVSFEGEVKLTDFGIARTVNMGGGMTQPGTIKGKMSYMAPEQARGLEVDARADVFALGVVLCELCSGRNPFERETPAASLTALLGPDPEIVPPSKENPLVPPELDRTVMSALERDPKKRTASAKELASQLNAVLFELVSGPTDFDLRGLMHELWPDGVGAPERASEVTRWMPSLFRDGGGRKRGRGLALIAVAMLVGAGVVAAVFRPFSAVSRPVVPGPESIRAGVGAVTATTSPSLPSPPAQESSEAKSRSGSQTSRDEKQDKSQGPMAGSTARPPNGSSRPAPVSPRGDGTLKVRSSIWAVIYVDGKSAGYTPVTVTLPAGNHHLRAEHAGLPATERTITIRAGEDAQWSPRFE